MIWLVSYWLELVLIALPFMWPLRKYISGLLIFLMAVAVVVTLIDFQPWYLAALVLVPFRVINMSRILKGRMHPEYLRRATIRTSWWLTGYFVVLYGLFALNLTGLWVSLPVLQFLIAITMLALLVLHIHKTRHITNKTHYSDTELPTVSICVPARNETQSLEHCIQSLLASEYPKLEILVLDDCSQDRTAEIIKSFAHDGVRFVKGDEPQQRWLSKNQAYDKLLREANGEYVLFCGVDARLGTHAIRSLVTTMLNRKKSMISVMPLRFYSRASEAFLQPMRYWWELVPPRVLFNRPAVLSTCWMVHRKSLLKLGGFAAVSHAIIPEGYFARHFIKDNGYSFIRSNEALDVQTTKSFSDQWSTAIRSNYPQIRRRPELAFLLTFFAIAIMILPFGLVVYAMFTTQLLLFMIAGLTATVLVLTHVLVLRISDPSNVPLGFVTMPLVVFLEIIVGITSMLKYEFGRIDWKDRNICIPVMHVIPKQAFMHEVLLQVGEENKKS